ncbi:MAG: hypothetical protein IJL17_14345 [Kiritimatiellae bacterium]|nr:hypothetical protein [Kiritimatiellia bacterium]
MPFSRLKYGIIHHDQPDNGKSGGLRWLFVVLGLLLVASFILARLFSRQPSARIEAEEPSVVTPVESPTAPTVHPVSATPKPAARPFSAKPAPAAPPPAPRVVQPPPDPQATRDAAKLLDTMYQRPAAERVLLEKLAAAERQGEMMVAIDTIKRLCERPAVADLHPRLWERLGQLNMQLLLSDRSSPWTARVTVKRGDSRDRLARDNRTTSAALDRLNPKTNWARIKPGDVVRVLQYPKAVLVIHKGLRFADLSLKGSFFHRYPFSGQVHVPAGVYPVTREPGKTAHAYLRTLGVGFSPEDRADLEMFLAPESSINVSDQ